MTSTEKTDCGCRKDRGRPDFLGRLAGKMMARMMKLCPCSGVIEQLGSERDGEASFEDFRARMAEGSEEGGFCAKMMAACCASHEPSGKDTQGA